MQSAKRLQDVDYGRSYYSDWSTRRPHCAVGRERHTLRAVSQDLLTVQHAHVHDAQREYAHLCGRQVLPYLPPRGQLVGCKHDLRQG